MAGSSVFEYVHVDDHKELADHLELTLATRQSAPSPSSLGSDETNNTSDQGTMNPDGKSAKYNDSSMIYIAFKCSISASQASVYGFEKDNYVMYNDVYQ